MYFSFVQNKGYFFCLFTHQCSLIKLQLNIKAAKLYKATTSNGLMNNK